MAAVLHPRANSLMTWTSRSPSPGHTQPVVSPPNNGSCRSRAIVDKSRSPLLKQPTRRPHRGAITMNTTGAECYERLRLTSVKTLLTSME